MPYTHLTPTDRGRIQAFVEEGKGVNYIADMLGRHPSTISRELARNRTGMSYLAQKAQQRYEERRKACRPAKRLGYLPLWRLVFDKIGKKWTPEQVAGRLPLDYPDEPRMRISYEALYQNIYADKRMHCLIADLPQARPKRRKRGQGKTRRGPSIPDRVDIQERPEEANARLRHGDWEGDTIVGAKQQGFIVTLAERTCLLARLRKCDTKQADEVAQAVIDSLLDMPVSWVKTITFDNGTEFAGHRKISQTLPASIYFAAPYASYQRGTNENTNGLIRRYLPKGKDFRDITQHQLDQIAEELNNRPRKKLGYRTPNEVFQELRQKALVALEP